MDKVSKIMYGRCFECHTLMKEDGLYCSDKCHIANLTKEVQELRKDVEDYWRLKDAFLELVAKIRLKRVN